jgi:hypothetical protein
MATKYLQAAATKGAWTTITATAVASGDVLVISGGYNPNHLVVLGLGGTTPSGTWTISGGDYDNTKAYDSTTFSGETYKYILGMDGSRVAQDDTTIEFTCTTSGNVMAFYS